MERGRVVALTALVGLLAGLALSLVLPSGTPYSLANRGDSGLSRLATELGAEPLLSPRTLRSLPPGGYALISIRSTYYTPEWIDDLLAYAGSGGVVIASGSRGYLNAILSRVGGGYVANVTVYDMVVNLDGNRSIPIASIDECNATMALPGARVVNGTLRVVGYTSQYSYADLDGDGYLDFGEPIGREPVIVEARIGKGSIIIITAPGALLNPIIDYNRDAIECLTRGRRLLVDQIENTRNPFEYIKVESVRAPQAYSLYLAIAATILAGVVSYGVNRGA